jgi:SOUL heme-binding protein
LIQLTTTKPYGQTFGIIVRYFFKVATLAFSSALSFQVMAYEEPRYRLIETAGPVEIREYAPTIVAEVEVEGDRSEAASKGFRVLAGYIFGANKSTQKIAMTAPVTQEPLPIINEKIAMTAPVTQTPIAVSKSGADGIERWRVTFTMPSQYTMETLPKPDNASVRLSVQLAEKRATIRFSGFSTVSNLAKHRAQLEAFIAERKLQISGPYTVAFYNDPFTLPWNRRNEWWVGIQM